MASEGDVYDVLVEMLRNKKLPKKDKKWFTQQLNRSREHQMKMMAINWFTHDPTAKYWVGAGIGMGAAAAGSLLDSMGDILGDLGLGDQIEQARQEAPKEGPLGLPLWFMTGGPGGLVTLAGSLLGVDPVEVTLTGPPGNGGSGPLNMIPNLMQLGGLTFTGLNIAAIMLHETFQGTDLGELMTGVGEILPP